MPARQPSGLAGQDLVGQPARTVCQHRPAVQHRFQRHQRAALVARRMHEDIGGVVPRVQRPVVHSADKVHAVPSPGDRSTLRALRRGAVAHQHPSPADASPACASPSARSAKPLFSSSRPTLRSTAHRRRCRRSASGTSRVGIDERVEVGGVDALGIRRTRRGGGQMPHHRRHDRRSWRSRRHWPGPSRARPRAAARNPRLRAWPPYQPSMPPNSSRPCGLNTSGAPRRRAALRVAPDAGADAVDESALPERQGPPPGGRRGGQTRGRPCCGRGSSCPPGRRAGTCGSPRNGHRTPGDPTALASAPGRRRPVARRPGDDGDVPAFGQVMANQIVQVALEPAVPVQRIEGSAKHHDAKRRGISHATLGALR